jgi:hypothetical protein
MARARVSPGSAAARLARWRWHRNPPLSRALVKRLMEWRSPDYPAIKALAQSRHPATEADSAIRDLMAQYERPDLKAADLQHLKKTLAMVEEETGVANRSNPPSVYNSLQRALKARGFNTFNRRDNADDDTTDPEINLGHGLSLALDNSGWPCGVVKITTKPEWTMVDRYWQDDPSATEIASRVAAFAAKHGVKSNPRRGRRLAQAHRRIRAQMEGAHRRFYRAGAKARKGHIARAYLHATQMATRTGALGGAARKGKLYSRGRFFAVVRGRRNPVRGKYAGTLYRLADGDVVTKEQLRRMFMGKIPGPVHLRLLGIEKVKKNPIRGGRRAAAARNRLRARTAKSYVRALKIVRRKVPSALTMPALSKGFAPSQAVWQRHAAVSRRAVKTRWTDTTRRRSARLWRKAKPNPIGGRRAARSRCRIVGRATLRARINKASGGARNAVMRSILAQVMAGKVKIRGARISAAVKRGIRRGR